MGSNDKDRKSSGKLGESIACTYLQRRGFRIIERNYRKPWGEIDIIAEKADTVRFVEVKTLSHDYPDGVSREKYYPEEHAHPFKLRKVARTAELYMAARCDERDYQIDVIGIFLDKKRRVARCRLFEQVL